MYLGYGRKSQYVPCRPVGGNSAKTYEAKVSRITVLVAGLLLSVPMAIFYLISKL